MGWDDEWWTYVGGYNRRLAQTWLVMLHLLMASGQQVLSRLRTWLVKGDTKQGD